MTDSLVSNLAVVGFKFRHHGKYSGFIAYSLTLSTAPSEEQLVATWVEFFKAVRNGTKKIETTLLAAVNKSRSWTSMRWSSGCRSIFPQDETNDGGFSPEDDSDSGSEDE